MYIPYTVSISELSVFVFLFLEISQCQTIYDTLSLSFWPTAEIKEKLKKKSFHESCFCWYYVCIHYAYFLPIIVEIRISSMFNDTAWRPKNLILLPFQKLYPIVLNFLLQLHVISNKCHSTVYVSVLIIIKYMLIHFFLKINGTQNLKLWTPLYQLYVMYIAGEICPKISIDH